MAEDKGLHLKCNAAWKNYEKFLPKYLSALKNEKTSKLTLKVDEVNVESDNANIPPIVIDIFTDKGLSDDELDNLYDGLHPEKHEVPMWEFLKKLNTPIVITLDRTIAAEIDEVVYIENAGVIQRRIKNKSRVRNPLSHVQDVTSERFAEYRKKAIQNDNELKDRIVMSALQNPLDSYSNIKRSSKPKTQFDIDELEKKVIEYLSKTIKTENVERQIKRFFRTSRSFSTSARRNMVKIQEDMFLEFVFSQYRQIENLAEAFNYFETQNEIAFKDLKEYLDVINKFFKDSGKIIYFDESTGRLVFSFINNENDKRLIQHLSSGEKQILILFTFLAFIAESGSLFIVDEPELSLHPKWQYEFMEAFLKLKPKNTQLLLATHSPEIVGKFKSSCISLQGWKNV